MKKILCLCLMLLLLLAACGDAAESATPAPEADAPVSPAPETPEAETPTETPTERLTAAYTSGYAALELPLPAGWVSSEVPDAGEDTMYSGFGLDLSPEGAPELTLRARYYPAKLGLCGTGVTFEEMLRNDGKPVTKATETYSGGKVWTMYIFAALPGSYAIEYSCEPSLAEAYGADITAIIEGAVLGGGHLSCDEATEIAEAAFEGDYAYTSCDFDHESGLHTVTFTMDGGERERICVDPDGNIVK